MVTDPTWEEYPATYRTKEMQTLARWIAFGESGSVVGLPGCGRSNLFGFLCNRPDIFCSYLPEQAKLTALIPVDLNDLPAVDLGTFYRVILRSFYRVFDQFDQELQEEIACQYRRLENEEDAFVSQSALQDLILLLQSRGMQVVLVLNNFDRFYETATPQMLNTLRGLRDRFRNTLCYIVGMFQEVAYLSEPEILGDMYELLDNYVLWVGSMNDQDARNLISQATHLASESPTEPDIVAMLALTGRFPALLRMTCHWWLNTKNKPDHSEWAAALLSYRPIQHRLTRIWTQLTQEEQYVLSEIQKIQLSPRKTADREARISESFLRKSTDLYQEILTRLVDKGVCCETKNGWHICSELLAIYVAHAKGRGRGKIWLNEETDEIYQGDTIIEDLTELGRTVLTFLVNNPKTRHTKTDIIISCWPDDLRQEGVTDNSLYQVILAIRKAIEPNLSKPAYLINWRGKPEGGYQFFPEGRPG